jgi:hypothetical protein
LVAGVGSVLAGFLHVLLRARLAGGGLGTLKRALESRTDAVLTIAAIDFIAGVLAALVGAVAGASEPGGLVRFVNAHPLPGWMAVGLVGPFLSDRLFSGSIVRGRFDPRAARVRGNEVDLRRLAESRGTRISDDAWRLRAESLKSIEMQVWIQVQRALGDEADRLRACVDSLAVDNVRMLARLPMHARDLQNLPRRIIEALDRVEAVSPNDPSYADLLLALAEEMLLGRVWEPIEVLCAGAAAPST